MPRRTGENRSHVWTGLITHLRSRLRKKYQSISGARSKNPAARLSSAVESEIQPENAFILVKLPLELRELIYEYAFESLKLTVAFHESEGAGSRALYVRKECSNPEHTARHHGAAINGCLRATLLAMPLTCRQLYTETIESLYRRHMWAFNRPADFLQFKDSVPSRLFNVINSLTLWFNYFSLHEEDEVHVVEQPPFKTSEWNQLWSTIAAMPRPQHLRLSITRGRRRNDRLWQVEDGLLDPLWDVKRPKDFSVWLSWHTEMPTRSSVAPFRLETPKPA